MSCSSANSLCVSLAPKRTSDQRLPVRDVSRAPRPSGRGSSATQQFVCCSSDRDHNSEDSTTDRTSGRRQTLLSGLTSALGALAQSHSSPALAEIGPPPPQADRSFFSLWPPLYEPYLGFGQRETLITEAVPGTIWVLEQPQSLGPLVATIRCTVVKLASGELWVHAPLAPTEEFFRLVDELGSVAHVIVPTFALEHKVYAGPAARHWPKAKVYVTPDQWAFPVNLPNPLLGIPVDGTLAQDGQVVTPGGRVEPAPWAAEIDSAVLEVTGVGVGPSVEVDFFHKESKTLIVTDAVEYIPTDPPPVVRPDLLLSVAPDDPDSPQAEDTAANRRAGWSKMCLLVNYFGPEKAAPKPGGGPFAPLVWQSGYEESFEALSEKLVVAPIVRFLIFAKGRDQVKDWLGAVTRWDFERIIPAHYATVAATSADFQAAYAFLDDPPGVVKNNPLPDGDLATLRGIEEVLLAAGVAK